LNFEVFDDQSPTLWNSFVGNWTRGLANGFNNNTITATPTIGASLSFTFAGSQAWLYGALLNVTDANGELTSYPTAEYSIDGVSAGSQKPWIDTTGAVVYFQTPKLADADHKIDINVTSANSTDQFILDFFLITPSTGGVHSGIETSRSAPAPSSTSGIVTTEEEETPVGAIVGGVVGGIAGIAILAILAWYFLRKRSRGGRAYYFDNPAPADMLEGEDHVEPFNAASTTHAPSSAGFSGPGPQSAYSDGSSHQPLNPSMRQTLVSSHPSQYSQSGPSDTTGPRYVSGITAQPRTGKAALIAQQYENTEQPVQLTDSGVRFNANGEPEEVAGPSQLPVEVPPTYTPN